MRSAHHRVQLSPFEAAESPLQVHLSHATASPSRRMETLLRQTQTVSDREATRSEVYRLKEELQAAWQSVRQLETEKESPYVKFFYATDDKQIRGREEDESARILHNRPL